jgi:hypothetical protein
MHASPPAASDAVRLTSVLGREAGAGRIWGRVESFSRLLLSLGGALWDTGPHAVSLPSATLGEVVEVSATQGVGDLTTMTLLHRPGAISAVTLALDVPARSF